MSLVRDVRLASRGGRPVLVQEAVDPFGLHGAAGLLSLGRRRLPEGVTWLPAEASGEVLRIDAEFEPGAAGRVGLVLRAGDSERTELAYDSVSGELSLDRTVSGNVRFHETFPSVERVSVPLEDSRLRLRVFLDRCSVEVFAQDGLATITDQVFPGDSSTAVGLLAEGDGGTLVSLAVVG
jgi:levanase/fructan beta-fructosidase